MITPACRGSAVFFFVFTLLVLTGCGSGIHICPSASSSAVCGCGAGAVACPLPPPHLYADGINGQISVFSVDRSTGALGSPISVQGPAYSLGIAALNDQFLYVSDFGLGAPASIDVWSIDQSTGALTPAAPFALGTLSIAGGLAVNFNDQVLYVADAGKIDALKADATTGALSKIPGSPFTSGSNLYLTIDPGDRFLFASVTDPPGGVAAFTMNSITGALTPVAGTPFAAVPNSTVQPGQIVVDSSGKFVYVTLVASNQIAGLSIDASTGALTPVPGSPFSTGNSPLTLTTARNFLYVSNLSDATLSGYTIDPTTGTLSPMANSPFPISAGAMTSDALAGFFFVSGTGGMTSFMMDPITGALTPVGSPITFAGATALTYVQ